MHTCSPPVLSSCRLCTAVDFFRKLPRFSRSPKNCWPARNPEQSVCWFQKVLQKGIPKTWPKSLPDQCRCTHGAGEEHNFSSQSLFWGRRNCSRNNVVMSGQNELVSVGIPYFLCGSPGGSYLTCSDLLPKGIDSDCSYFLSRQLK